MTKVPPTSPLEKPGRRARKRESLTQHLSDTAFELFEEEGYEAITMERIADAADVAKATLYSYFPVKEALLAHRFRQEIATGMAGLGDALKARTTFPTRMRFLLKESAKWHESRRNYMAHYLRFRRSLLSYGKLQPPAPDHGSGTKLILSSMFQSAQDSGELDPSLHADHLAWMFEHMLVAAVVGWLDKPEGDLNQEFQFAFELLLHGASTQPRKALPRKARKRR